MQIAALQSGAAHSKCTHAAVSACCVSWESNPVCTDSTGLVVTPPSEEEVLLWGIPCVSQIPVACRVMKFIILAAYPPAEAVVGCEFFWCVFPLQEGKNKVSVLLFLPSPSWLLPSQLSRFSLQFAMWVDAVIFVFSLEDEVSFQTVYHYYSRMANYRNTSEIPMVLVGTQGECSPPSRRGFGTAVTLPSQQSHALPFPCATGLWHCKERV